MVAICPPAAAPPQQPLSLPPSSQVITTEPCCRYQLEPMTSCISPFSHASAVEVEQSWPSLQRFGVPNRKGGAMPAAGARASGRWGTTRPRPFAREVVYGASGLPTTSLSSRFSMTMTITCGGPAGAAVVAWVPEDAAEVVEPAGVGLGGSRLGTTIDGAALDGDDAGVGL